MNTSGGNENFIEMATFPLSVALIPAWCSHRVVTTSRPNYPLVRLVQDCQYSIVALCQSSLGCHNAMRTWCLGIHRLYRDQRCSNLWIHLIDYNTYTIEGLVQERRNSIANALELRLSSTNPSRCTCFVPLCLFGLYYRFLVDSCDNLFIFIYQKF